MFQKFDPKAMDVFGGNPADFLNKLTEFQQANFEAARQMVENNVKAFQELASVRDPQTLVTSQQAILQAAVQKNMDIMSGLWQSLGVKIPK